MDLFIVKFYDADVEENAEMEYGNLKHAEEIYIKIEKYENGTYTKIK